MPDIARELARRVAHISAEAEELRADAAALAICVLDAGHEPFSSESADRIRDSLAAHAGEVDRAIRLARASLSILRRAVAAAGFRQWR